MANAVEALINALAIQLQSIPGLTVQKEWPDANKLLTMPSVSLFQGKSTFLPLQPYEIAITAPDLNNQVIRTLVVGEYDLTIQVDLWCRTKSEREQFFALVFAKLNPDIIPMGLSLQLTDYYNLWARYDIDSHQFLDDEQTAQTRTWRVQIMVLANSRAVLTKPDFAIIVIDNQLTTPDTVL